MTRFCVKNNLFLYIFEVAWSFYMMLPESSVIKDNKQYPLLVFFHLMINRPSLLSPHSAISFQLFPHVLDCSVISSFSLNSKLLSPACQTVVWNLTSHWAEERNMRIQHICRAAFFFKLKNSWTEVVKRQHGFFQITPKCQKPNSQGATLPQQLQWHLRPAYPALFPTIHPRNYFYYMRNTFPILSFDFFLLEPLRWKNPTAFMLLSFKVTSSHRFNKTKSWWHSLERPWNRSYILKRFSV